MEPDTSLSSQSQEMSIVEAQLLTLKILKQVMEEKLNEQNVQLAQVRSIPSLFLHTTSGLFSARTDTSLTHRCR